MNIGVNQWPFLETSIRKTNSCHQHTPMIKYALIHTKNPPFKIPKLHINSTNNNELKK